MKTAVSKVTKIFNLIFEVFGSCILIVTFSTKNSVEKEKKKKKRNRKQEKEFDESSAFRLFTMISTILLYKN